MIIAVDGPAAAGKGTIARALAQHFRFHFLDTGSLYRRVGLAVLTSEGNAANAEAAEKIASRIDDFPFEDDELRTETIAGAASMVAAMPGVRTALLQFQRDFAAKPPGAVLDGRDIGTVVCPDADAKLFVTASQDVRARRRFDELRRLGMDVTASHVTADIQARDERDRTRAANPLIPAFDAVILDTSNLTIDEAVAQAVDHVSRKMASSRSGTSTR
jgi:CMP/dCMP kinase